MRLLDKEQGTYKLSYTAIYFFGAMLCSLAFLMHGPAAGAVGVFGTFIVLYASVVGLFKFMSCGGSGKY